jgi:hypothetical protein
MAEFGCQGVLGGCERGHSVKTIHCVFDSVENLEEAIHPGQFQNYGRRRRHGGQFQVAIPLHRFFHATQQYLDSGAVHLADAAKVKDDARPVPLKERPDLVQEEVDLSKFQLLRQPLYYNTIIIGFRHTSNPVPGCHSRRDARLDRFPQAPASPALG